MSEPTGDIFRQMVLKEIHVGSKRYCRYRDPRTRLSCAALATTSLGSRHKSYPLCDRHAAVVMVNVASEAQYIEQQRGQRVGSLIIGGE